MQPRRLLHGDFTPKTSTRTQPACGSGCVKTARPKETTLDWCTSCSTGDKHVSDAAFGGDGPTVYLPMKVGVVTRNLGSQEVRYVGESNPQLGQRAIGERQEFWVYQYRNYPEKEWNSFYCFTEMKFLEADFNVMNFYTSQGQTQQRTTILVVKFLLGNGEKGAEAGVNGKLMLVNGTLRRNLGGETEVVQVCRTEEELIEALEKWFGINLAEE